MKNEKVLCKDCKYFEERAHYPICKNPELILEDDESVKVVRYSTNDFLFIKDCGLNHYNKCKHFKQFSWNFLK